MKTAVVAIGLLTVACATAIENRNEPSGLAAVKRIYVDQLGGGRESDQMRDMIISALQNSGLFTITENPERADASLRGSSDDKVYKEDHQTNDSIGLRANGGSGSSVKGSAGSASSSRGYGGASITQSESSRIEEYRHEATASIRLVDSDGDVIWSTTQESSGGKFRSALADIADRIARRLTEDTRKARSGAAAANPQTH